MTHNPGIGFNFSWAFLHLLENGRVRRSGWNASNQWLEVQWPDEHSKMQLPYIYLHNAQGCLVPWAPSQGDLFGSDWFFVDPAPEEA